MSFVDFKIMPDRSDKSLDIGRYYWIKAGEFSKDSRRNPGAVPEQSRSTPGEKPEHPWSNSGAKLEYLWSKKRHL